MEFYEAGDNIYLFGFSRGAFTVRSLAGMIYKCGLLEKGSDNLVEYASKIYNTKKNDEVAAGFKAIFSRACPVHFIGVWDTVKSLSMNADKKFHDSKLNPDVTLGYQALAIDEKREKFPYDAWDTNSAAAGQTIEQVWFAGVHSDVGGWYDERGLSNLALQWMLEKAGGCGMEIDATVAGKFPGNPHDEIHESYTGLWIIFGSDPREIRENASIHQSVKDRMENAANDYNPGNLPANINWVS
jgi:uncharacterized protein (DUF2235 family)